MSCSSRAFSARGSPVALHLIRGQEIVFFDAAGRQLGRLKLTHARGSKATFEFDFDHHVRIARAEIAAPAVPRPTTGVAPATRAGGHPTLSERLRRRV